MFDNRRWRASTALTAAVASAAAACRPTPATNEGDPARRAAAPAAVASSPPQTRPTTDFGVLGVGDVVTLDPIYPDADDTWFSEPRRVQSDQTLRIPLIGPVRVAGRTAAEAGANISGYYHGSVPVEIGVRRLVRASRLTPGPIGDYDLIQCGLPDLPPADGGSADKPGRVVIGRVDGRGRLTVPRIGPVKIAGLDEDQAGRAVRAAYATAGVSANARVSVLIVERAPADAGHTPLPDRPIEPVPDGAESLYTAR